MGRLIHTGLGSSSLIVHVLHSPPPHANSFVIGPAVIKHTQSKKPFLQEQEDDVVGQFLSQPTIQGLVNVFQVALAYEATLRWDDYEDMTFGDFIVTNDFVRVFLVIPRQTP
jgi:hypothetical protein